MKILNRLSNLPELVLLIVFLITVQIQRQDPKGAPSRLIIPAVEVIPENTLVGLCYNNYGAVSSYVASYL